MEILDLYKKHFSSKYYTKKGVLDFAKSYHKEMVKKMVTCPKCDGYGSTSEHDTHSHPNGDCQGMCPIQVQCEFCEATGFTTKDQIEKYNHELMKNTEPTDLPF